MHLSVHALQRGYEVTTWVCNVRHMDPTWFQQPTDLLAKLKARAAAKNFADDPRYGPAMEAVEQYLELGGKLVWGDLTPELIAKQMGNGTPLLDRHERHLSLPMRARDGDRAPTTCAARRSGTSS